MHFHALLTTLFLGLFLSVDAACTCARGSRQDQYCGYCSAVTSCRTGACFDKVYECNPQGGCSEYGPRDSCRLRRWDLKQCPI